MMLYVLSVFDVALFLQFLWDPDQALWLKGEPETGEGGGRA